VNENFCDQFAAFPQLPRLMERMLEFALGGRQARPLQIRDRIRAHFTSFPGKLEGSLANYSVMCSLLLPRADMNLSTITKYLVHPLASTCGVGEFIGRTAQSSSWAELVHVFSSWLTHATVQQYSVTWNDVLPYIVHNLSLAQQVTAGLARGTLMRLGGGFHGAAWEVVSRKLQQQAPWSEIVALCDSSADAAIPWIESNCKHHALGHGVMQYFMIRSLNKSARSLYSPCFPLQRYSQNVHLSTIHEAEKLCMTSPIPLGCCDGMYHHYFKYAQLENNFHEPTDWAWPCASVQWPEPCFQRAFVTHAVLFRWIDVVPEATLWPGGLVCNNSHWTTRVQRACVQALAMYTFIAYNDIYYQKRESCSMPYMLPSGIGVQINREKGASGSLPSLCSMLSLLNSRLDSGLWHTCVVGSVQAMSMYSTSPQQRQSICDSLRSAPHLSRNLRRNSVKICLGAFSTAGFQNNLGFVHYWTYENVNQTAGLGSSQRVYL